MNLIDPLKLSKPKKWLLLIGTPIGTILMALVIDLIQDSNAFQEFKKYKPIDVLINMDLSLNISNESILIALIVALLSLVLFQYKRINLYYQAAEKFGEYFYMVSLKYSKLTGTPVTINFKENKFVINAKDLNLEDDKKL